MTGLDLTRLSPADAAVTLRSLDRRFRTATRPVDDPDVEAWAEAPGPDGHSAREHVAAAHHALAQLRQALHQVRIHDDPELDEATLDPTAHTWDLTSGDLHVDLDDLRDAAMAMADDIEAVASAEWNRRGRVPGRGDVTAMGIVHQAIRSSLDHLEAIGTAMQAARRRVQP